MCLSELRIQLKQQSTGNINPNKEAQHRDSELVSKTTVTRVPFRPCNPHEAKEGISSPRRLVAKNPFQPPVNVFAGTGPKNPVNSDKAWKPSSAKSKHVDNFLNAPDVESKIREKLRIRKHAQLVLSEFKEKLRIRTTENRKQTVQRYHNRVNRRASRYNSAAFVEY
mmetsp:Transcript_22291/g.35644  ORF Transcript_22291/g.35644 Transcript_22291/m.35644 type:complete len:167 (-) Transcript_22291:46-546(-)